MKKLKERKGLVADFSLLQRTTFHLYEEAEGKERIGGRLQSPSTDNISFI